MKGTSKLPEVGNEGPDWIQRFLVAVKRLFTINPFPRTDKALIYNHNTGLIDWISLDTGLSLSGTSVISTTSGLTFSGTIGVSSVITISSGLIVSIV